MKSVLIIFLDGVGLGEADPEVNPFMSAKMPFVHGLLDVPHLTRSTAGATTGQAALLGLDATLGVPGLPQSGTGQTTILTGHNAPALLGEHVGPYPDAVLRELLTQTNLFKSVLAAGLPAAYANAYPRRFLDRLARGKGRLSANTTAAHLAGLRLRDAVDLQRGEAVNAGLNNNFWPEMEVTLPRISAHRAGQNLAELANRHALTYFEFWYSDFLGHKMNQPESLQILTRLDEFLAGVWSQIDPTQTLLLVVSDHGNFEDWTHKKHTTNPSLTIVAGAEVPAVSARLTDLADITPTVLSYLLS
jgi:hypothetical protein